MDIELIKQTSSMPSLLSSIRSLLANRSRRPGSESNQLLSAVPPQKENSDLISVPSTNTQWVNKPAIVNKISDGPMQLKLPASQ